MALELVTGYKGEDHVTAAQVANFQRGIYGDAAILDVGSKMAVSITTANQITIADGEAVFDGRQVSIGYGETVSLPIVSGTQGMSRYDLVVMKYTRDSTTGVESAEFEVIQGTPDASSPTDPTYTDTDIRTDIYLSQKPFARVKIVGTAITGIDSLVSVVSPLSKQLDELTDLLAGNTAVLVKV